MATTEAEINGETFQATIEEPSDLMDGSKALAAVNRAEIDTQIVTAKAHPRSITAFRRTAYELATLDEDTAASMFYNIPRDGKRIEGPTIRMAEILVYSWGNVRAQARIASIDDKMVTAVGNCFDIERNTAASVEVERGIVTKTGKRFGDDMIRVTCQAAMSIAYREAVFKIIPRSLFKSIYEQAKLTSIGKAESHAQLREDWLTWFEKAGVARDRVLSMLDRKGIEDINVDDLITLQGLKTALKDGETTIEEAFPDPRASNGAPSSPLNEKLKEAAGKKKNVADQGSIV